MLAETQAIEKCVNSLSSIKRRCCFVRRGQRARKRVKITKVFMSGEVIDSVRAIMLVDLIKPRKPPGFILFTGLPMLAISTKQ